MEKYKKNYNIPLDALITPGMVRHHWELERSLTRLLLASVPEDRWMTWERCYSQLYRECPWLISLAEPPHTNATIAYGHFSDLIGPGAQTIYEVGSGEAGLIRFLAGRGHSCIATEVTQERGEQRSASSSNFQWHSSDGVNLDRFEPANHYDVVISTQVIEHLHPDDLTQHFKGVLNILATGWKVHLQYPA